MKRMSRGGGGDRLVAAVEHREVVGRQCRDGPVEHAVAVERDHAEPPSRRAEVLRERVDGDRVRRQDVHQRAEPGHERPVDVVGDDDQPRVAGLHDVRDPVERPGCEHHRRWVRRVHHEQRLDRGIGELVDLGVRELPGGIAVAVDRGRVDLDHVEVVAVEARDLEVRRERRHHQRDAVAGTEQEVGGERVEDVADRRRTTLDREEVPVARRGRALEQLVGEVLAQDLLDVSADPVGARVPVADDAVDQLVHERVGVEAERLAVVDRAPQQLGAVGTDMLGEEAPQPRRRRHCGAGMPPRSGSSHTRRDSVSANWPRRKNAARGVVATQLGLPRPASSTRSASEHSAASCCSLDLNSKGLSSASAHSCSRVSPSVAIAALGPCPRRIVRTLSDQG